MTVASLLLERTRVRRRRIQVLFTNASAGTADVDVLILPAVHMVGLVGAVVCFAERCVRLFHHWDLEQHPAAGFVHRASWIRMTQSAWDGLSDELSAVWWQSHVVPPGFVSCPSTEADH